MSSNTDGESVEAEAREQFEPARGSIPQEIDVAEDEHPIKQALGKSSHRKLKAHEGTLGERFAFRYSRSEAFIREYLANAETGCIRRARYELKQVDSDEYDGEWFESHTIAELLDEAREVTGYHPIIEVHSSPEGASMDRFRIEDNGIGISVNEFIGLKELGLSASHDEGTQLGQFGQGVMSVFNAVGEYGELTLETYSRRDGANYRERFRITGFNDLPGTRDNYGTTWKIPAFSDEAADMDIEEAMEEYTEAMYVPVIYHTYDGDGTKQGKEEYTYTPLAELVSDTEPAFVYEDEYVEAVMSPAISNPKTFLVSQPIERGCTNGSFDAPAKFHLRIKKENGCIYKSTHEDRDNTGLIPVVEDRFENELIKSRNAIHPGQLVPGDIVAYDVDGYETRVVPTGVDDEYIETIEDLQVVDIDISHPDTDSSLDPTVVDGPHEGVNLVDEETWNSIETDVESTFVPYSQINLARRRDLTGLSIDKNEIPSGYDIQLVQPVDDRDRFEDHDGAMIRAVSKELNQTLLDESQKLFERVAEDGFSAFYDFDKHERDVFTVAYEEYIGEGEKTSALVVGQKIKDLFDVQPSSHLNEQMAKLSTKVEHAPRSAIQPNKTSHRENKKISTVIRNAGADGTVYMGSTIHADKANLVWEIHEQNQVVAIDGSHMYDEYKTLFDWVPLKTIDLRGIADKYDVSDDIAEKYERAPRDGSGGGGVSLDELDAATREIKIRGSKQRSYSSSTPKEVKDTFESENPTLHIGRNNIQHLLVFPETDVGGVGIGRDACGGTIGRTIVPKYVTEYLEDVDNCYVCEHGNYMGAMHEIRQSMLNRPVDVVDIGDLLSSDLDDEGELIRTFDPTDDPEISTESVTYDDLGDETAGVVLSSQIRSMLDDDSGIDDDTIYTTLTKSLVEEGALSTDVERIAISDPNTIDETLLVWNPNRDDLDGVDLIRHKDAPFSNKWGATSWRPSNSLKLDLLFPEEQFPRDTPEWNAVVEDNAYRIKRDRSRGKAIVDLLHHMAKHVPDDVEIFPSQIDDS